MGPQSPECCVPDVVVGRSNRKDLGHHRVPANRDMDKLGLGATRTELPPEENAWEPLWHSRLTSSTTTTPTSGNGNNGQADAAMDGGLSER